MVPGGKLRHDAAESRMHGGLGMHDVAQDAPARTTPGGLVDGHHRSGRLVAARLDPEYPHAARYNGSARSHASACGLRTQSPPRASAAAGEIGEDGAHVARELALR